jgi:hypothetical protein
MTNDWAFTRMVFKDIGINQLHDFFFYYYLIKKKMRVYNLHFPFLFFTFFFFFLLNTCISFLHTHSYT